MKVDPSYDEIIPPTYQQPLTYIRSTKRIDDENDIITDYMVEDEDLVSIFSVLLMFCDSRPF